MQPWGGGGSASVPQCFHFSTDAGLCTGTYSTRGLGQRLDPGTGVRNLVLLLSCLFPFLIPDREQQEVKRQVIWLLSSVTYLYIWCRSAFVSFSLKLAKREGFCRWPLDRWRRRWGICEHRRSALARPHCRAAALSVPGSFASPHSAWKALAWDNET